MSNDEVLITHPPTLNVTTPSTQNGHRHRIFEADYPEGVFWKTPPRDDATDISYARRARAGLPISVCTQECVFKPGGFAIGALGFFWAIGNWNQCYTLGLRSSKKGHWINLIPSPRCTVYNVSSAMSVSRSPTTRIPVSVGMGTLYSSRGRRRNYVQI